MKLETDTFIKFGTTQSAIEAQRLLSSQGIETVRASNILIRTTKLSQSEAENIAMLLEKHNHDFIIRYL